MSDSSIWTAAFWRGTAERAVSTAAQAGILVIGADQLNVLSLDWSNFGGFVGGGFLLSVLKGLAANAITKTGPGFIEAELPVDSPALAAVVTKGRTG